MAQVVGLKRKRGPEGPHCEAGVAGSIGFAAAGIGDHEVLEFRACVAVIADSTPFRH